jgi:hypothetical protein
MNFFNSIVRDLRERKLWPVAVALLVAIVAVPLLLSKSTTPRAPSATTASAAANPATAVPAVNVSSASSQTRLTGHAHDPFAQQKSPKLAAALAAATGLATSAPGTSATAAAANGATGGTGSSGATGSAGATGSTGSTGSSTVSGGSTPTTPSSSGGGAKPAPAGLSATESYRVQLAMTKPDGGLDTIDPLERLSVLPSSQQPLLVELGVLKGGHQVLFAVEPTAVLSGPGTCTPAPVDCEILSLAPDQIESLSAQTRNGLQGVAQFAVAGIKVDHHPSAAASLKAREQESALGRQVLAHSTLPALSLFQYQPDVGAVIDLRNLTVGGN